MGRAKKTPADELAEVDAKIAALEKEGQALSARQGEAEALLRSYDDRRSEALLLRRAGEEVEVPDEVQLGRLRGVISQAKEEQGLALKERRQLEDDERPKLIAAGLPHFDGEAEAAARAIEALGETL